MEKLCGYFNLSYISLFFITFELIQKKKKKRIEIKILKITRLISSLFLLPIRSIRLILKKIEYIFLPFSYFFIFSFYTLIFEFHTSVLEKRLFESILQKKKKIKKKPEQRFRELEYEEVGKGKGRGKERRKSRERIFIRWDKITRHNVKQERPSPSRILGK